jgi:hypothetical protein
VNSGFPLIANADQRPLMRPPDPGVAKAPTLATPTDCVMT